MADPVGRGPFTAAPPSYVFGDPRRRAAGHALPIQPKTDREICHEKTASIAAHDQASC